MFLNVQSEAAVKMHSEMKQSNVLMLHLTVRIITVVQPVLMIEFNILGKSILVLYNDVTTSRRAQKIPYKGGMHLYISILTMYYEVLVYDIMYIHSKAFTIQNNKVDHLNLKMNGFELNMACAVTMSGQSYIFQAAKQSNIYGQQYVLILGWVQRLQLG